MHQKQKSLHANKQQKQKSVVKHIVQVLHEQFGELKNLTERTHLHLEVPLPKYASYVCIKLGSFQQQPMTANNKTQPKAGNEVQC